MVISNPYYAIFNTKIQGILISNFVPHAYFGPYINDCIISTRDSISIKLKLLENYLKLLETHQLNQSKYLQTDFKSLPTNNEKLN